MRPVEIPVGPKNARFSIALNGTTYRFRFMFDTASDGAWVMDIGDAAGTPILAGVTLVTGTDLLGQHRHLGFGGALVVTSDRSAGDAPTYDGLGTTSRLFFVPDA